MSVLSRVRARAFAPVDIAGLIVFRVMFGAVLLVEFIRYCIAGWVDSHYVTPTFLFKYQGLGWVEPLPRVGMWLVFGVMMIACVAVVVGAAYRVAMMVLVVGQAYTFSLAATYYLNHAYLLIIIALLMVFVPADSGLSVEAWRRPARRRGWAPAWTRWLLLGQLMVVYTYGGIAKINPDWLAGEPVRGWLRGAATRAPAGLASWISSESAVQLMAQGGLWFDLLVCPALLWRRTRWLAVTASLGFHLTNAYLFHIGVFPWFMLLATTLFFEPDWPRRLPWVGRWIDARLGPIPAATDPVVAPGHPRRVLAMLLGWAVFQLAMPLRHHLYPGDVAWTEEGHYYAWRMKLRSKFGSARYVVRAPATGESWVVDPAAELSKWQVRKMVAKPQLIVQYAHHLARRWQAERGLLVEVRAQVQVSLNKRPRHALVDPTVDLAAVKLSLWPATWILPAPTERAGPRPSR